MPERASEGNLTDSGEIQERYQFPTEKYLEMIREVIEENRLLLPDFLDLEVIRDNSLYSIYKESYFCILCGFYNAGLILLGQLMEITLKEIILINTGDVLKGTFGKALEREKRAAIMDAADIAFLQEFKDKIRNPYAHRDFRAILGYGVIPVWRFDTGQIDSPTGAQAFLDRLEKFNTGISQAKVPPQFIDPCESSVTATLMKEKSDPQRAIFWAWRVYEKLELFSALYLSQEKIEKYIQRYGSPFDNIVKISIEEDSE